MNEFHIKKEVNINTFIVLAGFTAVAVGWGITWGATARDIAELIEFKQVAEIELRRIENLTFRVSASERANETVVVSIGALKDAVSQQSGDIKVMREILQRIEQRGRVSGLGFHQPESEME